MKSLPFRDAPAMVRINGAATAGKERTSQNPPRNKDRRDALKRAPTFHARLKP
jgi:hypothetical protein